MHINAEVRGMDDYKRNNCAQLNVQWYTDLAGRSPW